MKDRTFVRAGSIGAVIAAICCFTLIVVVALGAVDLSVWLSWLDYVFLRTLFLASGMIVFGIWRRYHAADCYAAATRSNADGR